MPTNPFYRPQRSARDTFHLAGTCDCEPTTHQKYTLHDKRDTHNQQWPSPPPPTPPPPRAAPAPPRTANVEVINSPLLKGTVGRYIPGSRRLRNGTPSRNRGRNAQRNRRLLADAAGVPVNALGTGPSHTERVKLAEIRLSSVRIRE